MELNARMEQRLSMLRGLDEAMRDCISMSDWVAEIRGEIESDEDAAGLAYDRLVEVDRYLEDVELYLNGLQDSLKELESELGQDTRETFGDEAWSRFMADGG